MPAQYDLLRRALATHDRQQGWAKGRNQMRELPAGGRARDIVPRLMDFDFAADTPRYWMNGDAYTTTLLNALSLTFPEGERFFVAAVRSLRHHVTDPALARQVRGFLAQESLHRREHDAFNDWLRQGGVDVDRFYAEVAALLRQPEEKGNALLRLAVTCALEHFTAILAEEWLTSGLADQAHPNVRPLWSWHAIEELDHKAVAYDVYEAAGGGYSLRALTMITVSIAFIAKATEMHMRLLRAEGQLGNLGSLARGVWKFWGPRGHFSRLLPAYLRYFKPSFHPWDRDDSALIARIERELSPAQGQLDEALEEAAALPLSPRGVAVPA
jgi:predicted metal-dependent hydrolase